MTIEIVRQQQDDQNSELWHFKIAGPDTAAGAIRLADLSRETTSPADWLAANQAEAQAAIDAGVISEEYNERSDFNGLKADIANELAWIETTLTEIDAGLNLVDAATLAQLRVIVRGVLQNQRRILWQQRRELRAWRYVNRRLD